MTRSDSHGRHGGNRGSADTRTDDNPTKRPANTDVDSQAENRNAAKGAGRAIGR